MVPATCVPWISVVLKFSCSLMRPPNSWCVAKAFPPSQIAKRPDMVSDFPLNEIPRLPPE